MNRNHRRQQSKHQEHHLQDINNLFLQAGQFFQRSDYLSARQKLQEVVDLMPQHHLAWRNLGECARMMEDIQFAGFCLNRAIDENPKFYTAYEELADLYQEYQLFEQATAIRTDLLHHLKRDFEEQIEIDPQKAQAAISLSKLYDEVGEFEKAEQLLENLAQTNPSLETVFAWQVKYPPIFQSAEQQEDVYERIAYFLDESMAHVQPQKGFPEVFSNLPFYNAYIGHEPREMQQKLAKWYLHAYPALAYVSPHIQHWQAPAGKRKIRLGFCSSQLNTKNHSVGNTILDLIHALPPEQFEVIIFAAKIKDKIHEKLQTLNLVKLPVDHAAAHQIIAEHQLDILYYTDIGMDDFTYFLAFARLAPIQCVWGGHPITTGIPAMDYFMSTTVLDVPGAEAHYSETLVRLDGPPTRYARPNLPDEKRPASSFGLPEGKNLYLCAQYFFKIHPHMDLLFAEILRQDPNGILVIVESKPGWKEPMMRRWQQSMPDVVNQVIVLPLQPFEHFLSLLETVNVVLDTFPFGSGNTAYQTFASGTPLITKPGTTCRSRGTYSLYHLMGMTEECVATTDEDYVRLALHYGTNPSERARIKEKILEKSQFLFDNLDAVKAQVTFLTEVVNQTAPAGQP